MARLTVNDVMADDDLAWMERALELARQVRGEVPVAALVVREDVLLGSGVNRSVADRDPTAHAEIVALRAAARRADNYRLPGATLYVTIEPCTMCAGALIHARVARLVFGAREPRAGAVFSTARALENPGINHRVVVTEGVCASACAELVQAFFRSRRGGRSEAPV